MTGEVPKPDGEGERITNLERQVELLSASISELVENLKASKLSHASPSKRKVEDDSEEEEDTGENIVEDTGNQKNPVSVLKIDF